MEIETGNGTVQKLHVWPSTEECRKNPHRPDCKNRPEEELADETAGYSDSFCECHDFQEPILHANGTDISWPAGFTNEMADAWRRRNGLARPSEPGAGP